MDPACSVYAKTASAANLSVLNTCSKCKTTLYCSCDCQKADWSKHKIICSKTASSGAPNASSAPRLSNSSSSAYVNANTEHSSTYSALRLRDLEEHIPNPFTCLVEGTFLHNRPEKDVFKLLINSYRIREADDMNLENKATPQSVYTGASSSIVPFKWYLTQATTQSGLLPAWRLSRT
jgi:splicing suppressor protein 51